jgi:hypothetical protein
MHGGVETFDAGCRYCAALDRRLTAAIEAHRDRVRRSIAPRPPAINPHATLAALGLKLLAKTLSAAPAIPPGGVFKHRPASGPGFPSVGVAPLIAPDDSLLADIGGDAGAAD